MAKQVHEIINRFVIWETEDGYIVTDRKQRFELCNGTIDKCRNFTNQHPYGMTLAEMSQFPNFSR